MTDNKGLPPSQSFWAKPSISQHPKQMNVSNMQPVMVQCSKIQPFTAS